MAGITSRFKIIEIEPQVRPLGNRNPVVRMQVTFAPLMPVAKLGEHSIHGRVAKIEPAEVSDDGRFKTAIGAPPAVALKAENPEPAVVQVIAARRWCPTPRVMFTLSSATVLFTRTAGSEFGTSRERAGAQDYAGGVLVCHHPRLGTHTHLTCRDLRELHVGLSAAQVCHWDVSPSPSELSVLEIIRQQTN
jgi:hypothetical protein